jgi:MFS superfamily sulfate permease-like transporter
VYAVLSHFRCLFVGYKVGITVSLALSLVMVVKNSAYMRIKVLGRDVEAGQSPPPLPPRPWFRPLIKIGVSSDEWVPIAEADTETDEGNPLPGVLIVRLAQSLTFCAFSFYLSVRVSRQST